MRRDIAYNKWLAEQRWKQWKKEEEQILREEGASEETIQKLREYDWEMFKQERRFLERQTPMAMHSGRERMQREEIYDEKEIESAINAVKKEFKYYWNCNLKTIEYDDDYSQKCIEKYTTDQIERKNLILILCNFNTGTNCPAGLSENSEYDNYEWLLIRKGKNGSWHIKERGY